MSTEAAAPAASPAAAPAATPTPAATEFKSAAEWVKGGATADAALFGEGEGEGVARETGGDQGGGEEGQVAGSEAVGGAEGGTEGGEEPKATDTAPKGKVYQVDHNGVKYDLPADLPLQYKVNGEMQTITLEKALKANSAAGAVSQAKEDARLAVQGAKAEIAAANARAEHMKGVLKKIRENPALADRLASDPDYAQLFEEGVASQADKVGQEAGAQASRAELVAQGQRTVMGWMQEIAPEFAGVDPNEVLASYRSYLLSPAAQTDEAALTPGKVREFFERAHGKVKAALSPLEARLARLEAENQELKGALKKNGGVEKAVARGKAPPVGGGGAGVASGSGNVTAINKDGSRMELRDATSKWASQK